jgi:hypothetical protein
MPTTNNATALKPFTIVRTPVGVNCSGHGHHVAGSIPPAKGATPKCMGVMFRLTLSRLEEGLGHEGFQCDKCGRRVKYVPPEHP